MTTITPKLSSQVKRREAFLTAEFRKTLNGGKYCRDEKRKSRLYRMFRELNDRYGYTVTTYSNQFEGLTRDDITQNERYALD